jgi:anti-sigma factor RsiW
MRCDHARERIGALLDGELSGRQRQDIAEHAETCPACARYRDELKDLSARLAVAREPAPRGLARRIQARLAVEQSATEEIATPEAVSSSMPAVIAAMATGWRPALRQLAVVLVACVVSVSATVWQMQAVDTQQELTHDVLAAHVRSLLQDKTVQVASDNTHNVKPWFAGRLEFTPVVKDLTAEGFELIGGRVDFVGGRRVAALVYRKGQHQVNVFTWPSSDAIPLKFDTAQGYNVARWSRGSMAFWAISDLNPSEMRELPPLL